MAQQKIRIRLKGYDHTQVDLSARSIVETAQRSGATVSGPVPLPTEKNVYCVIRSPFKDKDSREHFEIRTHKRLIDIHDPTPKTIDELQRIDGLRRRFEDVDQPLVRADLELLARLLVDVRGAVHREALDVGRKRNRPGDPSAGAADGVDDLACGLIEHPVIERFEADPYVLCVHAQLVLASARLPAAVIR